MTDLCVLFAPLGVAAETETQRIIRGTALAVAQEWALRLPDGPQKQAALKRLADAAELACGAAAS